MAERPAAATGDRTSLRGLRERMVAVAQAVADERRHKSSISSFAAQSPNTKSAWKPVIDGSVLKNDIKQRLAKERREERKRQQEANKEMQLLEKERRAKLRYEKQLEEKLRKIREQKERDEQRRISAEEKRKQKLEEDREKYKAVLSRTMEQSNRVDQRRKRWSWEGSTLISESRSGKTENKRSSSLNRRESKVRSCMDTEHMNDKPARHFYNSPQGHNLMTRTLIPTRVSVARSKSAASLSSTGKYIPGISKHLFQYVTMPLRSHSSDELKTSIVFCKSTVKIPLEKIEIPLRANVEISPKSIIKVVSKENMEAPPVVKVEAPPVVKVEPPPVVKAEAPPGVKVEAPPGVKVEVSPVVKVEVSPDVKVEATPVVNVETPTELNMGVPSEVNIDVPPMVSQDASPGVSVESSPVVSLESSPLVSVEASPVVSMDTSPEVSMDTSPEVSVDSTSMDILPETNTETSLQENVEAHRESNAKALAEANVKVPPEVNVKASTEATVGEAPLEASVEVPSEINVDASLKKSMQAPPEVIVEASPQTSVQVPPRDTAKVSMKASSKTKVTNSPENPEIEKQTAYPIAKKRLSHIPCYRWPSAPASGWRPPSPISTVRQIQKNRPPSPSPMLSSKQSAQTSLSYKIIPVQRTLFVPNALGAVKKKRDTVSKSTNKCEAVSQKHMIYEESGNRSTSAPMSAEEATKILTERRRLAREQKDKNDEERLQKEVEAREVEDVVEKVDEGQVQDVSKCEAEQLENEQEKNKGGQMQEDREVTLQKGDAKIKAQEDAESRKKEHERIMLQNLQERLERKKRIEEIMKRTRKTDANASKTTETSGKDTCEGEADEDIETESNEDSVEEMFASGIRSGRDSSAKHKVPSKNAGRMPQKLVFLQDATGQVDKEKKVYFNGDVKAFRQKSLKDSSTQGKDSRVSTKRTSARTAKTGKAKEIIATVQSTPSVNINQKWVCDQIIDISHNTESPATNTAPDSHKHNLKDSVASHQSPQTSSDQKERKKGVSGHLGKASPHVHFTQKTVDLEPSPASNNSRVVFGGEEDSDTQISRGLGD